MQKVVKENGIPITLLVKRVGYKNRASFYAHIADRELSYDILFRYGRVLKYNFADHFSEMAGMNINDPDTDYRKEPLTLEQAVAIIDKLKEQHYNLLVKYEQLMERYEQLAAKKF